MSLGVLNNLPAMYAENNLNNTQNSLTKTLQQLSSGSRINSGADDAAGLSLVDGLAANAAALSQSETNATEGVGLLQVADGALSQVTSLLNRAVTLATEASNGTLNNSQLAAANQEYQSILSEISNIGSTTTYNGNQVFTGSAVNIYTGDSTGTGSSINALMVDKLSSSSVGDTSGKMSYTPEVIDFGTGSDSTDAITNGGTLTLTSATGKTIDLSSATTAGGLLTAINAATATTGLTATATTDASGGYAIQITGGAWTLSGTINDTTATTTASVSSATISYTASAGQDLSTTDLTSQANAQSALTALNSAISDVAAQDGYIGAQINTLNAVSNVEATQQQNVVSAQNAVQATDYAQASSDMSKYEILSQTGIAALAQANSVQQEVTKLLQ